MRQVENLEARMNLVFSRNKRKPICPQLWEGKEIVWKQAWGIRALDVMARNLGFILCPMGSHWGFPSKGLTIWCKSENNHPVCSLENGL